MVAQGGNGGAYKHRAAGRSQPAEGQQKRQTATGRGTPQCCREGEESWLTQQCGHGLAGEGRMEGRVRAVISGAHSVLRSSERAKNGRS